MTQLGRLSLLLRKAEREDLCMLPAKEGGGRSPTSRRLAIAPPDASDRSMLLPTKAAGKQRRPGGSPERRPAY